MPQPSETLLTPRDVNRALLRHKKKSLFVFGLTLVVVVAGVVLAPRAYVSEAKLFVRLGRESVSLDPTATTGQTISVYESRENEINSVLEMLKSRVMIERVVDTIGPDVVLGRSGKRSAGKRSAGKRPAGKRPEGPGRLARPAGEEPPVKQSSSFPLSAILARVVQMDAVDEREQAIQGLTRQIGVWNSRKSSVIAVNCKAETPDLAQHIVDTLLDVYQEEHMRANRTEGSYKFFDRQAALLRNELSEATGALRDAKNEMGLVSIEGQQRILEDQINRTETEMANAAAALTATQAKVASLRKTLDVLPEQLVAEQVSGLPNVAGDSMRDELYKLEIRERELLAQYVEDHPLVVAVRDQVESSRAVVEQQEPYRTQTTTGVNPVHQQLHSALLTEESQAASLQAQGEALREQYARLRQQLQTLNEQEVHMADLQRRVDLLETNYMTYSEKLEQSRVDQALESDRISNVNVVQPASWVGKPTSPKKRLMLGLGLTAALLGGIGVALGAEYFDPSFRQSHAGNGVHSGALPQGTPLDDVRPSDDRRVELTVSAARPAGGPAAGA